MSGEKEIGLLRPAKAPSINAPVDVQIRQISDSIKNINSAIRGLQEKLNELEVAKAETFKYIKGRLNKERTVPNSDGEVELRSSNKTISSKANGNILDIMVKNIHNTNLGGDWNVMHNIVFADDNIGTIYGETDRGKIYHDGTSFVFDSQHVGTGDFLFKNGFVGIGESATGQMTGNALLSIGSSVNGEIGGLEIFGSNSGSVQAISHFGFVNTQSSLPDKRLGMVNFVTGGSKNSGRIRYSVHDGSTGLARVFEIFENETIRIGDASSFAPSSNLEVIKDHAGTTSIQLTNKTSSSSSRTSFRMDTASSQMWFELYDNSFGSSQLNDCAALRAKSTCEALILSSENASGEIRFFVGGIATSNNLFVMKYNGRFGVGITSPDYFVDVVEESNTNALMLRARNLSTGTSAASMISISNNAHGNASSIIMYGSNHSSYPNNLSIVNQLSGPLNLGTNGTTRLTIDSSGHINSVTGSVKVATGQGFFVNGKQIISDRQAHIADADGTLADITTKFNTLLSQLETHGVNETS